MLVEVSSKEDFFAKVGQSTVLRIKGLGSKRVGLIGLGQSPSTTTLFKGFSEVVVVAAKSAQASSNVAIVLTSFEGLSSELKLSTAFSIASEKKLKYAEDVSSGILFGSELVNSPANILTPEASKVASIYNDVFTAKILDVEQCKELKMVSYLGFTVASTIPSHFIHLCYKPPSGPVNVKLALVGEGLTFN
ncbi:hypothetical protein RYX36_026575, partial [Vicia faba]